MASHPPAILTYHSQNIGGHDTSNNDHVAFEQDLEALHRAGKRVAPLNRLLDCLDAGTVASPGTVCITFDDGCDFDVRDLAWPGVGMQRSMLGIMRDFIGRHGGDAQPELHATAFVIASPEARSIIDRTSLFGEAWMNEDWWPVAAESGLVAIGNHGWDHNHPDLAPAGTRGRGFADIADEKACDAQIMRAGEYIEQRTGIWPEVFAYPFGESSAYLREVYFPRFGQRHRCRAAVGTEAGPVTENSDRWNLPRYVCGRDWATPSELLTLLEAA